MGIAFQVLGTLRCSLTGPWLPGASKVTQCHDQSDAGHRARRQGHQANTRGQSDTEMQELRNRMQPFVKNGQSEPYKTTTNFDNTPAAFAPPYEA